MEISMNPNTLEEQQKVERIFHENTSSTYEHLPNVSFYEELFKDRYTNTEEEFSKTPLCTTPPIIAANEFDERFHFLVICNFHFVHPDLNIFSEKIKKIFW